jgi:hypothetical protein
MLTHTAALAYSSLRKAPPYHDFQAVRFLSRPDWPSFQPH